MLQVGAQFPHGARETRCERHFRGVPARDRWQVSVRALDIRFLHTGVDETQDASAENKQIADLQLLDEVVFDRTEPTPAQQHINETVGCNRADVDQELARDARMHERDNAVTHLNFSEEPGILFLQGSAAAFEVTNNLVKLIAAELAKWIGAPNECKCIVRGDRRECSQADDVLRDDVVWFVLNANWIERARSHQFRCYGRFNEVVDIRRDQHAVAGAIERMAGTSDALNRARNAFRCRYHDDEIDRADVDAEFEAGRANDGAQFAVFQTVFDFESNAAIERSVMCFDLIGEFGQELFQAKTDLLRRGANIREDKHRLARPNQFRQLCVKARAGVARRWIWMFPDRRKDFDDRFLFGLSFGNSTCAIFAYEELREYVQRRGCRRKANANNAL